MTRISTHLNAIEAWLKGLVHADKPLVTGCRQQLDLIDAEDITRLSFAAPFGFVVLPRFQLQPRADGGKDCELTLLIAIAAKASVTSSADADALDRAIALVVALEDEPFGQVSCSYPAQIEARPVLAASTETKGLSIVAITFRQMLYLVAAPPAATQGLLGMAGFGPLPNDPVTTIAIDDGQPTVDEQAIIAGWSGGS